MGCCGKLAVERGREKVGVDYGCWKLGGVFMENIIIMKSRFRIYLKQS